jgi:hypothetical protein
MRSATISGFEILDYKKSRTCENWRDSSRSLFVWDQERRAVLRAELDAYYARLYGLNEEELRYILDPAYVYGPDFPGETFRVLKEKEIKQFGEYRTRRLVLDAWERLNR